MTIVNPCRCLADSDVHLWYSSLEQSASSLLTLRTLLSADELSRAKRFHFERDRRRFIVARGLLRHLLEHYVGVPAPDIRFTYSHYGKPDLDAAFNPDDIRFNVSHSGEVVVYALTRGRQVGVDVEEVRDLDDLDGIATSFFSPRENAMLATVSAAQKPLAFFNCWTRKEAYIKADGQGLSLPLDSFDVTLLPGEMPRLLAIRNAGSDEANRWTLDAFMPADGYVAAVVAEGTGLQIHAPRAVSLSADIEG